MWTGEDNKQQTPNFLQLEQGPEDADYHRLFRILEFSGAQSYFLYFIYSAATPNVYRHGLIQSDHDDRRGLGGVVASTETYSTNDLLETSHSGWEKHLVNALCGGSPFCLKALEESTLRVTDVAVKISPRVMPAGSGGSYGKAVGGVDLVFDLKGNLLAIVETDG
jgi:hypothetical protein